jgi:hypothetical protein
MENHIDFGLKVVFILSDNFVIVADISPLHMKLSSYRSVFADGLFGCDLAESTNSILKI